MGASSPRQASNGTRYELTVPAGALTAKTIVTMTPIARVAGLPGGKSTRNGVHFAPEGLHSQRLLSFGSSRRCSATRSG